ncbi:hypothetical protein K788_0002777 [Paraburkholderia caribensis MBA4]|uniref:Uncharacterized protein n=1 Tax=Paraburkholderia caribensis MBA4 TaxID=1323664 RepID=A0A0P0RCM7_9BURK|nr:hypothetical protein K788_0002777 [Paraburkholderia caribensis MBA4]
MRHCYNGSVPPEPLGLRRASNRAARHHAANCVAHADFSIYSRRINA